MTQDAQSGYPAANTITFSCRFCHFGMTVSAQLAGVTGPCPQCGQTITAPFPAPILTAPMVDLGTIPQPARQDPPAQLYPQGAKVEDTPRYLPPKGMKGPGNAQRMGATHTRQTFSPGIMIAVLMLLAGLGYLYFVIQDSRKAAKEALSNRQSQHEQAMKEIAANNELMRRLNEQLSAAPAEPTEGRDREESNREGNEARRFTNGGHHKLNPIDMEPFATEQVMAEVASHMPLYENGTPSSELIAQAARVPWMKNPIFEWPQILLHNEVSFNGHTGMSGGSSFIVEAEDGSHWLISGGPLIGEDAGVNPPLAAEDLDSALRQWKAFPPQNPGSFISAAGLAPGMDSTTCVGILALRLPSIRSGVLPAKALKISQHRAAAGDTLYLIGLPYYDDIHPQNAYLGKVDEVTPGGWTFSLTIDAKVMTKGFCGAPVLNADGEVAGILTHGHGPASNQVTDATLLAKFIGH